MSALLHQLRRAEVRLRLIISLPLMILLVATAAAAFGYAIVINAQRDRALNQHLALARSIMADVEREMARSGNPPFETLVSEVAYHDRIHADEGVRFVLLRMPPAGSPRFYDPIAGLTSANQTDLITLSSELAVPHVLELGTSNVPTFVTIHTGGPPGFFLIALEPYSRIRAPALRLLRLGGAAALLSAIALFAIAWLLTAPLHRIAERIRELALRELVDQVEVEEILDRARKPEEVATLVLALEQALNSLVNLKRSMHGIIESMDGGIIATDEDGIVRYVNSSARTILGLEGQLSGRPVLDILPAPIDNRPLLGLISDLVRKQVTYSRTREIPFQNGRGERLQLGVSTGVVPDEEGRVLNYIVSIVDLSDLVELQDQVRRADRLSALGSMATKVAHEIRNPLGSVKGLAQLVLESAEGDTPAHGYAQRIVKEANRLSGIVDDMLDYSQRRPLSVEKTDLNGVVKESLEMAHFQEVGRGPTVLQELDLELPEVLIDRNRFMQAVLNIVVNAQQAVGADGIITVSTYRDQGEGKPRIALEISDNGPGIPQDVLEHMFDPFYTTKEHGSGLGLSIAHTIIREHEAAIQVESKLGQGTTFRILLPRERWEGVIA